MADPTDQTELSADDLAEIERASLNDEIAERWDPSRLVKLVAKRAGRGQKLDAATRSKFEQRLGVDLGHVKVYTGEFAEEVTRAHGAEAVTIGTTGMVLMRGTPDRSMATAQGQALLAHELTHVAQEERGLYRETEFSGGGREDHAASEAEAEKNEAAELDDAAGSGPDQDLAGEGEHEASVEEDILGRVLEMFAEAERVARLRNGDGSFRP